jgi:acetylornithine deacetylase/succinyl-diaminopimelate desuccinylase-like protein
MIDHVAILADLVRRPSVNPMGRDVSGPEYLEGRVTDHLLQRLAAAGIPCARQPVSPGRDNVLARLDPPNGATGPLLLWDAHQDTVPADGMTIEPFTPLVRDGRLQGRGACDVKGGMAAMLVALETLGREGGSHRPILFAATVNEEFGFSGAKALAGFWAAPAAGLPLPFAAERPAAAIVAEPTSLHVVTTHKGAVRWRIRARGRACHSAFPENGRNAIYPAARAALAIESLALELAGRSPQDPCGPPTLSVGTIRGGMGVNLVPDLVVLEVDRRIVPGESPAEARQEVIDRIAAALVAAGFAPDTVEHEQPFLESAGLPDSAPSLSAAILTAAEAVGVASGTTAARYGTNASIYAAAGIPSVVFGPGSIAQAHTCDEWIDLAQVRQAADVLVAVARA